MLLMYLQLLAIFTAGEGNHNFVRSCLCSPLCKSQADRVVACTLDGLLDPRDAIEPERSIHSRTIIALVQQKLIGIHRNGSFSHLRSSALRGDCAARFQRTSQRHGLICQRTGMTTTTRMKKQTRRIGRGRRGPRRNWRHT
jgi:hypothetical protein